MIKIISEPIRIQAVGTPPKTIEEYIGRVASSTAEVSIARMISPAGWSEPGQTLSSMNIPSFYAAHCKWKLAKQSMSFPLDKRLSLHAANGFVTARLNPAVRSTLPFACLRFRRGLFIVMTINMVNS